jgi:hypothetical protein
MAEIKRYTATLYAGQQVNTNRALVTLFDGKGNTLGYLLFLEPSVPIPPDDAQGVPRGFYPIASYPAVLDLLRNESPVFFERTAKGAVSISTGQEAVGEGDKLPVFHTFPGL